MLPHALIFSGIVLLCTVAQAGSKPLRLLIIGNSLTAGYGLPADHAFPHLLEKLLRSHGYDVQVINAGVSGDTTAGGASRIGRLLADEPDAVMVELGANDALRGLDPHRTKANLLALITEIQKHSIPVLLAGMYAPPNMGREYEEEFNTIFPEVADETGVLFMPFFLEGVAGDTRLNQPDGIHPDKQGTAIIAGNVLPYAEKLLKAAETRLTE